MDQRFVKSDHEDEENCKSKRWVYIEIKHST